MDIIPFNSLDEPVIFQYFENLLTTGILEHRFPDTVKPSMADVARCVTEHGKNMFMIMEEGIPMAEFMLEMYTGQAIQTHFSTASYAMPSFKVEMGKEAVKYLFDWKDEDGKPYFKSLFGFIPVPNKPANKFVKRIGYKKQGKIPYGMRYLGNIVDCNIWVATKEA